MRIEDELRRALALRQHYELKKAELQQRVTEFARLLAVARVEIDTAKTGAKQRQFDEVTTRRTSQNINREICQINTHIAREEENWGNHEEIQRRYHEVVNSYGKIKREVGQLKNFLTVSAAAAAAAAAVVATNWLFMPVGSIHNAGELQLKMPSKLIRILRITFCYKQLCGRCLVHMTPVVKVVIHCIFALL